LKSVSGTTDKELKNKIKIGLRELDCEDCGSGLCAMADLVINGVEPSGSATRVSSVVSVTRPALLIILNHWISRRHR
jgi:hypothetical protein